MAAGSTETLGVPRRGPGGPGLGPELFRHEAIFHVDGAEGFLNAALPLIEQALHERAPVMIAVGTERIAALREALGAAAAEVEFADMRSLGANPARIIPAWRQFLDRHPAGGAPALGIGEPVWAGRRPEELDECERHEHLIDLAFGRGRGWRLVCPYDLESLDEQALERARHSHPFISGPGPAGPNPSYDPRRAWVAAFAGALPPAPADVWTVPFSAGDLLELRTLVSGWAWGEAMTGEPAEELVLAIHEIAANSVRHGGGSGTMRLWRSEDTLICEIEDAGRIRDPLLGRVRPGSGPDCGRGVWIANQLCDLVQIRSSECASRVRVHKRLA